MLKTREWYEQQITWAKTEKSNYHAKYWTSVEAGQIEERMYMDEINWLNGYIAGLEQAKEMTE